jgi:pimeloyl-ACP methyl ester carboxylesterase
MALKEINRCMPNDVVLDFSKNQQSKWIGGLNDLYTGDRQFVCIYLPETINSSITKSSLLVVVHGYGARRNTARGRQSVRRFANYWGQQVADKNWIVMAPHFDEKRFNKNYQRLNLTGLRSDVRLNQLIQSLCQLLTPIETEKRMLLGFSGGGQFVHRYLAFHEGMISRAVIGAPGWFMWPDLSYHYPLGFGEPNAPEEGPARLRRLCRQNLLLLVGDKDTNQGAFRKIYNHTDLRELQGAGRRDRATNWFHALKKAAEDENIELWVRFQILKNTAHRINQNFTKTALDFVSA